jgi:hypothetical protein
MEPRITINGHDLTEAQAMTVRVVLESFSLELSQDDALGTDEHGTIMRRAYLDRILEIRLAMYGPRSAASDELRKTLTDALKLLDRVEGEKLMNEGIAYG